MTDPVSRGTPPAPPEVRGAFPSGRWPLVERYADLLATEGVVRGLLGPREVPRLWSRHLANCVVLADALPEGPHTVCDIGTGAGLPGIVLALRRPDVAVTLVEPLLRRTTFLSEVVDELGLEGVEVVRGRAEDLHGERTFDVVTSRAVAGLDKLLGWSMPLVAADGELVAMKGERAPAEVEQAGRALARWRCAPPVVEVIGSGVVDPPTTVVRARWERPDDVRSGAWPKPGTASVHRPAAEVVAGPAEVARRVVRTGLSTAVRASSPRVVHRVARLSTSSRREGVTGGCT